MAVTEEKKKQAQQAAKAAAEQYKNGVGAQKYNAIDAAIKNTFKELSLPKNSFMRIDNTSSSKNRFMDTVNTGSSKNGSQQTAQNTQQRPTYTPTSAEKMQKKKEDRLEEKNPVDSAEIKKKRAEQNLRDFDENADYDWTDTNSRKAYDAERKRLQSEVDKAGAEIDARADAKTHEENMDKIAVMSTEDRDQLQQYIESRDARRSVFVNDITWFQEHKKETENKNALVEKYGEEQLEKLAETYGRYLHEQKAKEETADAQEAVNKNWMSAALSNIAAIPARALGGIEAAAGRLYEQTDRTGQYRTLEEYTPGDLLSLYGNAVTAQTAQNIAGEDGSAGRQVLSYGYQGLMSIADTVARGFLGGGSVGGASLAATSSFAQTMSDATQRGATPAQAALLATVTSGIEYATEKVPLDSLIKASTGKSGLSVLLNVLRQAGIEAGEEELSLLGSVLADASVMQEKSEYKQSISGYMDGGFSEEQARAAANQDLINQALETAVVSGIAGGIGGFGAAKAAAYGVDMLDTGVQNRQNTQQDQQTDVQQPVQTMQAPDSVDPNTGLHTAGDANAALTQTAADLAGMIPMQETQPIAPGMQNLNAAIEETLGVQPAQKSAVDTVPKAGYDNSTIAVPGAAVGRSDVTYTADNKPVRFQYAVVPAESLIASNDQYGNVNSAYPAELQPRDRTRIASQTQINSISRNLNPALLAESPTAQNGAPIIRGDGVVIGGNGRVSAITQAYGEGRGVEYQQFITEKAAELGIDPTALPANPVLVRVTNGVDNYTELANSLNASTTASYSATEAANSDASKIGDIIEYLSVSDDGGINTADNKDFIQKFVSHVVPDTERGDVMQANGRLSQAGERRIQNALFAYAYGDIALVERLAESTDNNAKNITNAMVATAGKVAKLQTEIGRGEVQDLGLQHAITDAVNLYLDAKAGKQTVEAAAGQLAMGENGPEVQHDGLTVHLAKFMESNNRSGKQIRDFIDILIDVNMNATADTAAEISMFDTGYQQTQEGLYDEAVTVYNQQRDGKGRIPEKSDFSQYRQYQPGELAAGMDGSRTEGNPGTAAPDGRSPKTLPADAPGGQGPVTAKGTGAAEAGGSSATIGLQNAPSGDVEKSRSITNTGLQNPDADIRAGYESTLERNPEAGDYQVKHNADTRATAQARTETPERVRAEFDYLMGKQEPWTAEDVTTARLVSKELFRSKDADAVDAINTRLADVARNAGQVSQAFSIDGTMRDAADPMSAVESATKRIHSLDQADSTFRPKKGQTYQQWQKDISTEITRIGMEIDSVEEGDAGAMRSVIRQIARARKTTAWFGASQNLAGTANRILNKLDFDTLKKIANTQLAAMPDDFRRRSKLEITSGIRKQSMLSSFKTFARNIAGNTASGLMDSISDSTGGRFADVILSKITGKRTVGNDLARAGTYVNAAKDAMDFASLCVELNIPIETEADSSFASAADNTAGGKYVGKTFRSTGNFAMRALYAYQKYMSYALEVSDKVFEGGTYGAVEESLNRLKNSGLTDAEISQLSEFTSNRRTFKDATWQETGSSGETKTHGSVLSRRAQEIKKPLGAVGDISMPFARVQMNVAQTGIDYTVGTVKAVGEIASIIRDAKAGKQIDVSRQRQAASDFGRGLTGAGLIVLFAAAAGRGIIAVHNSDDKGRKALEQSDGLSGAQINWSAWERDLNGENSGWKAGDTISSLDFLEPFNTHLYLAYELSKEDCWQDVMKAYPKASFQSALSAFMDSPMVQGISDIADLISGVQDANGDPEEMKGEAARYAGSVASSFVPQFVRQSAQTMDGYYRDTRGEDTAEYAKNSFLSAIPGQSQSMPKKIDGLGREQKRGDWIANFFDPTNTKTYQPSVVSEDLEALSSRTGSTEFYPDRQAPLTVKSGGGEEIRLTGEQRETYQKTYGENVEACYTALFQNADFRNLPDDLKVEALKKAKEFATGHARAAVSDFKQAENTPPGLYARQIIRDVTISNLAKSIEDLQTAFEYGYDTEPGKQAMESAYDSVQGLNRYDREKAVDASTGDAKRYIEVRDNGVSTEDYLKALESVKNADGTGNYNKKSGTNNVREIDIRRAIADSGLSDEATDIIMKAYMADYDPDAETKQKTELKYDYARQELGLSPSEYVSAYNVQLDGGKKAEKISAWVKMGYSSQEAEQLYRLFAATGKTKIDVESWAGYGS